MLLLTILEQPHKPNNNEYEFNTVNLKLNTYIDQGHINVHDILSNITNDQELRKTNTRCT